MLHLLSEYSVYFGPLRLFEYVTFRSGGAAATAFLIVLLLGPATARFLRRINGQAASRYADLFPPEWIDREKERTPCMGGVLIIGAVVASAVLWTIVSNPIALVLILVTASFAAIGFVDDYQKVVYKNRDGIPGKAKLVGQFLIAGIAVWYLSRLPGMDLYMRNLMVPFLKLPVWTSSWVLPFSAVVIVGASNAVNLTDGKDGLATGCTVFCMLTYAGFAYLMGHRIFAGYLSIPYVAGISEAVVFSSAVVGACIGFLWHNCHPASMFMGDTGSLALGGTVGMMAVLTRQELLLVLIGGVFVIEAASVIIQVASFKLTGKRVFLCAPIHHHFERKGWTESQIVVRFWILSGIFALVALASLKLR
jgi:phospho-N-acetylmuramoyl-pentapeptide-transferase